MNYMKDFPFFTTQHGVASLVLKQIPYTGKAYITLRDSSAPEKLLEECRDFCLAVGARSVLATGNSCVEKYPYHISVILMRSMREQLPDTDVSLFPVQNDTLERFREIYNCGMKNVDNAAYMSLSEANKVLSDGNGYFVHSNGKLLGVGIAGGERIDAIVAVEPGCGKDVVLALNHALAGTCVEVEVASTNLRAIRLYERLGFVCCKELSKWYKII